MRTSWILQSLKDSANENPAQWFISTTCSHGSIGRDHEQRPFVRIAIGAILQETNTFSPTPGTLDHFRGIYHLRGEEIPERLRDSSTEMSGFYDVLDASDHQIVPTIAAMAVSSGRLQRVAYETLRDELFDRLEAEGLPDAVHLWADCFREASAWGQVYYQKKRDQGISHACALRCLGQRLLKILFRMIVDKKPYDAELHARNQNKHGAWILSLVNQSTAKASA